MALTTASPAETVGEAPTTQNGTPAGAAVPATPTAPAVSSAQSDAAASAPRTSRALHPEEIDWDAMRELYPEDDGQPMSDNTKQFEYILAIFQALDTHFRDRQDVFVAGNLLWYPVEGDRRIRTAPDALVVFGRPKGFRGSYLQFFEGGIPPQVVFEVLSPKNSRSRMARKRAFYERYGVEEYYEYDPIRGQLRGWLRREDRLEPIDQMQGWVSPRLGVRFALEDGELQLYRLDGRRFATYQEIEAQREEEHRRAEEEHRRAEEEHRRAEEEHRRAEAERRRAEMAAQREAAERERADRLAAQLRALGIDPDAP